jgi:hypothetical protein
MKYLLTDKKRDAIIKSLIDNDFVKLKRVEKKSHTINGQNISFITPKFYWYFTPTDNLLSRKKNLKAITYLRVNNSINSYYKILEKQLDDYANYYRKMYNCKFNISRQEFDQVIEEKYQSKQHKCSFEEYKNSRDYLYDTIQEWNNGNKYSNLSTFKIDSFSGRVHSLFTMLSSDFFRFNDTFNVEIDLVNSQPVMLAHILKQEIGANTFSEDVDNGVDIYKKIQDYYSLPDRALAKDTFFELAYGPKTNLGELYPEANQWIEKKKNFDLNTYRFMTDTAECKVDEFLQQ